MVLVLEYCLVTKAPVNADIRGQINLILLCACVPVPVARPRLANGQQTQILPTYWLLTAWNILK